MPPRGRRQYVSESDSESEEDFQSSRALSRRRRRATTDLRRNRWGSSRTEQGVSARRSIALQVFKLVRVIFYIIMVSSKSLEVTKIFPFIYRSPVSAAAEPLEAPDTSTIHTVTST